MEKVHITDRSVHVGLKEPITAWLDLDGEKIVGASVRPGRSIEALIDGQERNPIQVIYLAERICGICSFSHIVSFVRAVEDAAGIGVPPRGQYIRALVLNWSACTHMLWAGWRATASVLTRRSTWHGAREK